MKTCFKCKMNLPLTEFYKHPRMADGRLNKCKTCTKKDVKENWGSKREHYRAYRREYEKRPHVYASKKRYRNTAGGKAMMQASRKRWEEQKLFALAAITMVNNAVRNGRLKKSPCVVCGSTKRIHGHHEDYSKPLDVIWLCQTHHKARHREIKPSF